MLQKFSETWARMGIEIERGDFLVWYSKIMKQRSEYIVREGDASGAGRGSVEGKKRSMAKGKGRAPVDNDEEEEDGDEDGSGEDGAGVTEKRSPIKLIIPGSSHVLGPSSEDSEDTPSALKAKIRQLVGDLRTEVERTDNLVEGKAKYKNRTIALTRDLNDAEDELQRAEEELERLEEVIERGNVERVQLKEKVRGLQAKAGELEKLRPEMEMFQREKGDYEEWKKTGVRRADLVRELKGVEEDCAWLRMCVLEVERERKEYEKESDGRRQELVEKLKGVEEDCERAWARASELEGVEQERDQAQARVLELEEVLGEFVDEALEVVDSQEAEALVGSSAGEHCFSFAR